MRFKTLQSFVIAVGAVALAAFPTSAQDQTFARSYAITPKDGMVQQFEAALKAHIEWRSENGDPWNWGVSTVEVGESLGEYRIRSAGHTWADFDAYDADFGPRGLLHWNATVAPLVESVSSSISSVNADISRRPPAGTPLAFVTVTNYHLRPGREADFTAAVASATELLNKHDFGAYALWTTPVIGGGPGPMMSLVGLYSSWADMAEPDPSFPSILIQELGEDGFQEWVDALQQTYRGVESYTLRLRPDLGSN